MKSVPSNRELGESEETIGTTSNPFWSVDRQEFVQAGSLEAGERLQTHSGDVKVVQQKLPAPALSPFSTLEVHNEHVYFVGPTWILVHNAKSYRTDTIENSDEGHLTNATDDILAKAPDKVGTTTIKRSEVAGDHTLPQKAIGDAQAAASADGLNLTGNQTRRINALMESRT